MSQTRCSVVKELEKIHDTYGQLNYQTLIPCNCSECNGSQTPQTYSYEELQRRVQKNRYFKECEQSFENVDVRSLLDDILYESVTAFIEARSRGNAKDKIRQGLPLTPDIDPIIENTPSQLYPQPDSSSSAMAVNLDYQQRLALIQALNSLNQVQYDQLVTTLNPPGGVVPPSPGSAARLLQWVEGPTGPKLDNFLPLLNTIIPLETLGIALPNAGTTPVQAAQAQTVQTTSSPAPAAPIASSSAKEVFISYAWRGESEEIANKIDAAFEPLNITLIRDKRDLGFKGRIKAFMEQIGQGKAVIVVISDRYLKSENCMFELVEIAKNGNFYDRIFPIILEDAEIYKPAKRIRYIQHWENEITELDEAMKSVGSAKLQGFRESIDLYTDIRNTIADLTETLKNMNALTPAMHTNSGFEELIDAVKRRLAS
jgi:hypothetical protein